LSSETLRIRAGTSYSDDGDGDREEDDSPRENGFVLMRQQTTIMKGVYLKTEMKMLARGEYFTI